MPFSPRGIEQSLVLPPKMAANPLHGNSLGVKTVCVYTNQEQKKSPSWGWNTIRIRGRFYRFKVIKIGERECLNISFFYVTLASFSVFLTS